MNGIVADIVRLMSMIVIKQETPNDKLQPLLNVVLLFKLLKLKCIVLMYTFKKPLNSVNFDRWAEWHKQNGAFITHNNY